MAVLFHDLGRFTEAREIYQQAFEIFNESKDNKKLSYVLSINNLAYLLEDMCNFKHTKALFQESLNLREKYYSDNPIHVASSKGNLARLFSKMGKYAELEKLNNDIITAFKAQKNSQIIYKENTDGQIHIAQTIDAIIAEM